MCLFTICYIYAIFNRCTLMNLFYLHRIMGTSPRSPPHLDGHSEATSKKTRQSTRLRRLTLRTLDQPRPTVNADPTTGRGSSPQKQKFHNYLGVVARKKIPIVHSNWKDVPESLKDLVWDYILVSRLNREMYLTFCY